MMGHKRSAGDDPRLTRLPKRPTVGLCDALAGQKLRAVAKHRRRVVMVTAVSVFKSGQRWNRGPATGKDKKRANEAIRNGKNG